MRYYLTHIGPASEILHEDILSDTAVIGRMAWPDVDGRIQNRNPTLPCTVNLCHKILQSHDWDKLQCPSVTLWSTAHGIHVTHLCTKQAPDQECLKRRLTLKGSNSGLIVKSWSWSIYWESVTKVSKGIWK